ncbi:MAG: hypothetical protein E6J31_17385 [Chloroflexi bacterium]|nr:MAG: hypothetical protein E6J36_19680 [Chloroflexota bacterium]TMC34344.1 MAG: hypothetical protein E6J31_17385 [Chloroflexota bacterium]
MASINSNLVERQIATTLARLASLSNLQGMYLVERQIATTLARLASLSNLQGMYLVERQIATCGKILKRYSVFYALFR